MQYQLLENLYKLKDRKDVVQLAKDNVRGYHDPIFFYEHFLGIKLHQGQKDYVMNTDPAIRPDRKKNILCPANRWGKTCLLAMMHIRWNYYKLGLPESSPNVMWNTRYTTLDISPHSNQVEACFNLILDILHNRFITLDDKGRKVRNKCLISKFYESHNSSRHEIKFKANSSFFGASTGEDAGSSLAGRQFGLITYDECVMSHHLAEELPGRIMSRTVDLNAPIHLVSTADAESKSQAYYYHLVKLGEQKKDGWYLKTGVLDDNCFIPKEIREQAKKKILSTNPEKYDQVVLGKFIMGGKKMFGIKVINNMFVEGWKQQDPIPGNEYLMSVDWGGSDTGDPTVIVVIDITNKPWKIVYHEEIKGGSPSLQLATVVLLKQNYNNATLIHDTNALGGVWIKKLLLDKGVKSKDFQAHGGDKGDAIIMLAEALNKQEIKSYYIQKLEEQLSLYQVDDKKLEQDYVVALYQAIWYLKKKERKPKITRYQILGNQIKAYDKSKIKIW